MAKIPFIKKVAQVRSLASLWRYRTELFSMFKDMLAGTYKASLLTIIALAASIIYLLSPFNIITDLVPVIGWIDDGFIFYFLLKRLMHELNRYTAHKSRLKLIDK